MHAHCVRPGTQSVMCEARDPGACMHTVPHRIAALHDLIGLASTEW